MKFKIWKDKQTGIWYVKEPGDRGWHFQRDSFEHAIESMNRYIRSSKAMGTWSQA